MCRPPGEHDSARVTRARGELRMERFAAIARELSVLSGLPCAPAPERSVAGGSINECYALALRPAGRCS